MRQLLFHLGVTLLSITLLSCGDDKSPNLQADKAHQVTTSINEVNQTMSDIVTTICTCSTPAAGNDRQKCIDENQPDPLTLSDCQTTATTCDPDSYIAYMNCHRDAYKALNNCAKSCPDSAGETRCLNAFDTQKESCGAHVTTELATAFQSCDSGQTPACTNTPKPDPKPGDNQCITPEAFLAHLNARSWISAYYAGSEGTHPCESYSACITEHLQFFPDNTYTAVWMNDPSHGSWGEKYVQTVCTHGTWKLQCNQLVLSDCRGDTTSTIQLTNNGFDLDYRSFKPSALTQESYYCTHTAC